MWPKNEQCAVSFTFDFDAESVWISENPANADKPGVLSQGRYAPRVAIPLILGMLERHGLKATFFVPGVTAETYPDSVKAIIHAGHESVVTGYEQVFASDRRTHAEGLVETGVSLWQAGRCEEREIR